MNRKDWRTVSIEDIDFNETDLTKQLWPTLHINTQQELSSPSDYGKKLINDCKNALSVVLPFTDSEQKFLDLLLEYGEIDPTALTSDPTLQSNIQNQPLLEWKVINIRRHKGLS